MNTSNMSSRTPIDTSAENSYWQKQFKNESYYEAGREYGDYEPAYRTGFEGASRYSGKSYDQVENDLKSDYERAKGTSELAWDRAKGAVKAAWHRVERAMPGDADNDGR